jgi:hypothetical protein
MGVVAALNPITFVSSALAPAVVLSGCAVLISATETKYSDLITRLRTLNEERRALMLSTGLSTEQLSRRESLDRQLALIFRRARHLRDATVMLFVAVFLIIVTCFFIALQQDLGWPWLQVATKAIFLGSIGMIFAGLIEQFMELRLSFRVVRYELELFDQESTRHAEARFRGV